MHIPSSDSDQTRPKAEIGTSPQGNDVRSGRGLPITRVLIGVGTAGIAVALLLEHVSGQVPPPGLTATASGTNLIIVVTNGASGANYEIYRSAFLGPGQNFFSSPPLIGTMGQTSFVANFGIETRGFFIAAVGSDWDGDGIPNYMDAQPSSTNEGTLFITIDNPTNGANVQ